MTRTIMRWTMAASYLLFGVVHLLRPDAMVPIVPDIMPFPREVILITGVCEIAGALALLGTRLRSIAGVMFAFTRCASGRRTSSMPLTASMCHTSPTAGSITGRGWHSSRSSSGGRFIVPA